MGQHKRNPTAIAAKNGELPPKTNEKRMSKRERERQVYKMCERVIYKTMDSLLPERYRPW